MSARYIIGDTRKVLATLPDASVDLIFTSPPFLALRSYLPADHPDKALEIGSEPTPGEFLDVLLDVVEECARVLAPHGSLVFELGDTYSGSGGGGGDYLPGGLRENQPGFGGSAEKAREGNAAHWRQKNRSRTRDSRPGREDTATAFTPRPEQGGGDGWPLSRSLCGIPEAFMLSLDWGWNMLRPERKTPRWRVRNYVAWCRPNPPVGALGDKFRPATSYLTVACKNRRYFDLDAVREPSKNPLGVGVRPTMARVNGADENDARGSLGPFTEEMQSAGAPPLDFWVIPTEPYPGSHYATFPSKLVVRPVKSMCPERVCRVCGKPSERITETVNATGKASRHNRSMADRKDSPVSSTHFPSVAMVETLGWSDCGHNDWRPGVVLDPFAGSGTTLAVATGHGRDAIGIDLDERNGELARERVGPMFFELEHPEAVA